MSDSSILTTRQQKLAQMLEHTGLPALVLNPGPSLTYMTGLHFHLSERPVLAFFQSGQRPMIFLPELETAKLDGLSFPVQAFPYGEDPSAWPSILRQVLRRAGLLRCSLGAEPRGLRLLEMRLLESAARQAKIVPADDLVASLRMRKDENELLAMRKAAQIAQNALKDILGSIKPGVTERELAAELSLRLMRNGSDSELPFTPIVSSGPNSANPHAFPSARKLVEGDLLVVDWGAAYQGYISDITRTFAIGKVDEDERRIHEVVYQANAAGRAAGKPGATCGDVWGGPHSLDNGKAAIRCLSGPL